MYVYRKLKYVSYFVYLGWWDIWCLWDDSLGVVIFWEENEGGFWRVGIFVFKVC